MSGNIQSDRIGSSSSSKENVLEGEHGDTVKVLELDGIVFPMPFFESEEAVRKRLTTIKNIRYEPGDVMICSFPKTGLHWTSNIVHFLQHDGPIDILKSHTPWFINYFDFDDCYKRDTGRILTTHLPFKYLPTDHFANGGKAILLCRNPKDSAVSMYHLLRNKNVIGSIKLHWDKFLAYWLHGKLIHGSFFDYYNKWQEDIKINPNLDILIVHYEQLKKNSLHEVRRIQNYLGLDHSDERLEAVIERCSLKNLKDDVDSGKVRTGLIDDDGKSVLYRKGIIGDWKNHFTDEQNEHFEAVVNEKMKDNMFDYKAWI